MALNIKSREVEELAAEVARMTGESKTEAIRRALHERRQRLARETGLPARQARRAARDSACRCLPRPSRLSGAVRLAGGTDLASVS